LQKCPGARPSPPLWWQRQQWLGARALGPHRFQAAKRPHLKLRGETRHNGAGCQVRRALVTVVQRA